jgi:hypothetical protein
VPAVDRELVIAAQRGDQVAFVDLVRARLDRLGSPAGCFEDYRGRFVFLDIPGGGKLLIIVDSAHAADFEALLAEAMPIVESFQFDFGR